MAYRGRQGTRKVRRSWQIVVLLLIIILGSGIGIGYAIAAGKVSSLNSDIAQYKEQISSLNAQAEQLETMASDLETELREKQTDYDSLLVKQSSTLEKLQTFQDNYLTLSAEYQSLLQEYEALKEACDSATVEELNRLRAQVASLERDKSLLTIQVAQLTKQLTPAPDHALIRSQVWGNPEFRSTAWEGRDYELQGKLQELGQLYNRTHTYIEGETDCNDMAVDLWNMLLTEEIKSVIVIGNLDKVGETFTESNHAWLYVFNADGKVIYLEPTTGEVIYGTLPSGEENPVASRYRDGFMYEKPSDLWNDLKKLLYQQG